jgi:hypothetical protein
LNADTKNSKTSERQRDFLLDEEGERQEWEAVTSAIDTISHPYGETAVSIRRWNPSQSAHVGGKISYTCNPTWENSQ